MQEFEKAARLAGYSNFRRERGRYCHVELEVLYQGYLLGKRQSNPWQQAAEKGLQEPPFLSDAIHPTIETVKAIRALVAAVPADWSVRQVADGDRIGFIIGTPRVKGVRSNTSVWTDDEDPAHCLLAMLLAARTHPAAQQVKCQVCEDTGTFPFDSPCPECQPAAQDQGHPMQPVVIAPDGVIRFKQNKIVRHLLDFASPRGCGLNELAREDFSQEDRMQLAQLIGYSVSGYGDLSYASRDSVERADAIADSLAAITGQEVKP